jgi:hypothetical protein
VYTVIASAECFILLTAHSAYVSNPGSYEDVVDLLVPELQKRGIMWDDYAVPGGTFRENLLGHKHLAEDHYGSKFKYGRNPELLKQHDSGLETVESKAEVSVVNGHAKDSAQTS